MKPEEKYELVYKDEGYQNGAVGLNCSEIALLQIKFKSVLDVGCGMGYAVVRFLKNGKDAKGIEVSDYLFKTFLKPLARLDVVQKGRIQKIPFPADSFDLVFCTDVLEHIPESDVRQALSELVRVSKKHLFLTVSLRDAVCFKELKLHETIRPVGWWDDQLAAFRIKEVHKETHPLEGVMYVLKKY